MKQPEFICAECPLEDCDDQSLFCVFRFLTKPNAAQKEYLGTAKAKKISRKAYFHKRYWSDPEKFRKAQNDRNRAKREQHSTINR